MAADLSGDLEIFFRDREQNILGATYNDGNGKIRLTAIYGPNEDKKEFYDSLDTYLCMDPTLPIIIGGDWNCTYSCEPTDFNIDIFRMRSPPSLTRSGWLNEICVKHHLMDPYRAMGPNTKDYTYVPYGTRDNRSRIDFFIIGDKLIPKVKKCSILPHLGSTLLDHRTILLKLNIEKNVSKQSINKSILSNPRIDDVVWAAVADCYLTHADPDVPLPGDREEHVHHARPRLNRLINQKYKVGSLLRLLREYNDLVEERERTGFTLLLENQLAGKNAEIRILRDEMWDIDFLIRIQLVPDPDVFLETLLCTVKGSVISYQTWVQKTETAKKSTIFKPLIF